MILRRALRRIVRRLRFRHLSTRLSVLYTALFAAALIVVAVVGVLVVGERRHDEPFEFVSGVGAPDRDSWPPSQALAEATTGCSERFFETLVRPSIAGS